MKRGFKYIALILIGCSLFLTGCGYKPSAKYVRDILNENVYVKIRIDNEDPENSVILKDALLSVVRDRFHATVVDNEKSADSILTIKLVSLYLNPIQYDKEGYVSIYSANITLNLKYQTKDGIRILSRNGIEEFPVNEGNLVSESTRFQVVKLAASKALEDMIPYLAAQPLRKNTKEIPNEDVNETNQF